MSLRRLAFSRPLFGSRTSRQRTLAVAAVVSVLATYTAVQASALTDAAHADPASSVRLIVQTKHGLSVSAQHTAIGRNGGALVRDVAGLGAHVVSVPAGQAAAILKRYQSDSSVAHAETDHARHVAGAATDPAYADQWALPKIGWDQVHGAVTPTGTATIAVLDTGVDGSNPDLAPVLTPGWSAFGTDPATDPNGHGTWVSSIAAAATDNGSGIAGVAYAGAKVMPVQVLAADGTGQDSDIISGVTWAADHGADVILMPFSNPGFSQALQDAVNYAWSKGAVVVAATGNGGVSTPTFPAGDASVMGVSATGTTDALWGGSNYGADTFLAAPGVGLLADAPGGGTASVTGTSASAAVVAGAAALLKATDPALTNDVVVGRLARTAAQVGTADQVGNGRLDLAAAVADTSTQGITPAGVDTSGSTGTVSGPYTDAAGSLTLTPSSGLPGTSVTVGSGGGWFNTNASVTITFAGSTVTTCTANGGGNLSSNSCSFSVPSVSAGTVTVQATDGSHSLDASFTVTGLKATSLVVSPSKGTYGGAAAVSATLASAATVLSGKTVNFSLNGTGVGSAVTNASGVASISAASLSGIAAATYNTGVSASFAADATYAASTGAASLTVNPKQVTGSFTATDKTYDGTTAATISSRSVTGTLSGDVVALAGGTATFADKNVASGKTVNGTGFGLTGAAAGNYTLASATLSTTASIMSRPLTGHPHRQLHERRVRGPALRHGKARERVGHLDLRYRRGQLQPEQHHGNHHRQHHEACGHRLDHG